MQREQISQPMRRSYAPACWLSLTLLAFAWVTLLPAEQVLALEEGVATEPETAESETAEPEASDPEAGEPEAAEEAAATSEAEAEKNESSTEAEAEEKADQVESKDEPKADDSQKSDEKPIEETKSKDEPAKSADEPKSVEKPEEMKSTAAKTDAKTDGAATVDPSDTNEKPEPAVEQDRSVEVDPPKKEVPKTDEKKPTKDQKEPVKEKCIIGATATMVEKEKGLKFRARVDTGAKSCSLHVEKIKIKGESTKEDVAEKMTENIGKVITFQVQNGDGTTHVYQRKIVNYVIIKNSNKSEGKRRYKVRMTFKWKNMEKEVLVTLNNRQHMEYPLLLGRNFLRDDFLVDVSIDNNDK